MIKRVVNTYEVEVAKAVRRKFTYLGPALMVLAVCCGPAMRPIARDGMSDYAFIAYVTPMALNLLGLLMLLMYCAGLIASELGNGSICFTLLRPVRRHEYLLAKLLLGMSYATVLTATVAVTSWLLTYAFGELTGVTWGGAVTYTHIDMLRSYVCGALLVQLPLWAAAAFAIMVSTLTSSAGAAVAATVGVWILVDMAKHPLHMAPCLFSSYLETPWRVFVNHCDGIPAPWFPDTIYVIATSVVSIAVFTTVSVSVLARRDLHT